MSLRNLGTLALERRTPAALEPSGDIGQLAAGRDKSRRVMIACGDSGALPYLHSRLPHVTMLFSVGGPDAIHQLQTDHALNKAIGASVL